MKRIVCHAVDFVFTGEIDTMNFGKNPVLKDGKVWKKIDAADKPVYGSSVKQSDAGPVNEETVSVEGRRNNLMELLIQYCGFHTVLRMSAGEETFYVGSLEYPCALEYTSDKISDSYLFKAVSPV